METATILVAAASDAAAAASCSALTAWGGIIIF
jgi:hypothetical protein